MRRKFLKIFFMFIMLFLILGLGYYLPEKFFDVSDGEKIEMIQTGDEKVLEFPSAKEISMEKKLQFLSEKKEAYQLKLINIYTEEEENDKMTEVLGRELKKLFKYGVLPAEDKNSIFRAYEITKQIGKLFWNKYYILDQKNEGEFLAVWSVWVGFQKGEGIYLWIEEESEKCIGIFYSGSAERTNWKKEKKGYRKYLKKELAPEAENLPKYLFFHSLHEYGFGMRALKEVWLEMGYWVEDTTDSATGVSVSKK